jgi:AcrR family transcriptional regulator
MQYKGSQERKQEIVDKALEMFLERGYHGLSVAQLAKETKIAKGLMYYYFESKEALLSDVIAHLCEQHVMNFNLKFKSESLTFYEKFMMILDAYHEIHPDNPSSIDTAWLSHNSFVELFHKAFITQIDEHITALSEEASRQGILSGLEAKLLIIMLLEGITGLTRIQKVNQETIIHLLEKRFDLESGTLRESGSKILVHFSN